MPSITSSVADRAKIADDTDQVDNNNISSDEDSIMSSASKSTSKAKGKKVTPSRTTKDKQRLNQSKDMPDENENCRVSSIPLHLDCRVKCLL